MFVANAFPYFSCAGVAYPASCRPERTSSWAEAKASSLFGKADTASSTNLDLQVWSGPFRYKTKLFGFGGWWANTWETGTKCFSPCQKAMTF